MNTGMLWFDNDPKAELSVKVQRAAIYYRDKYGKTPNLCFVHPSMICLPAETPGTSLKSAGVEIRPNRSILPNHLWIGFAQ
jgi:hypothetical protein